MPVSSFDWTCYYLCVLFFSFVNVIRFSCVKRHSFPPALAYAALVWPGLKICIVIFRCLIKGIWLAYQAYLCLGCEVLTPGRLELANHLSYSSTWVWNLSCRVYPCSLRCEHLKLHLVKFLMYPFVKMVRLFCIIITWSMNCQYFLHENKNGYYRYNNVVALSSKRYLSHYF